jgi:hypothetical protein
MSTYIMNGTVATPYTDFLFHIRCDLALAGFYRDAVEF